MKVKRVRRAPINEGFFSDLLFGKKAEHAPPKEKSEEEIKADLRKRVKAQTEEQGDVISKYYRKILTSAANHGGKWAIPNFESYNQEEIDQLTDFLEMQGWTYKEMPSESGGKTRVFTAPDDELSLVGGVKKKAKKSAEEKPVPKEKKTTTCPYCDCRMDGCELVCPQCAAPLGKKPKAKESSSDKKMKSIASVIKKGIEGKQGMAVIPQEDSEVARQLLATDAYKGYRAMDMGAKGLLVMPPAKEK